MDRRNMMMMTGMGLLAAALPIPKAHGQPPPSGQTPAYIFQDEFDGPLGAGPDPAKWTVQTWQDDVYPPVQALYRNDRIGCATRGGTDRPGIRLSPHIYNTMAEIDRSVAAIAKYMRQGV